MIYIPPWQMKKTSLYQANFADNTWAQIIDACHKNKVPATWVVGNQKTMTINGTAILSTLSARGMTIMPTVPARLH